MSSYRLLSPPFVLFGLVPSFAFVLHVRRRDAQLSLARPDDNQVHPRNRQA